MAGEKVRLMDKETFSTGEKKITLYHSKEEGAPLIVLNTYTGDGESVHEAMKDVGCPDCNLLVIGNLRWDHDMTPWYCPPLSKDAEPCTGGADEYLELLTGEIMPAALERIKGVPAFTAVCGYSLAGLFAVYALYKTDAFDRAASMSGSLWFPEIVEFCRSNKMNKLPDKLYLSLGDKEARTRNQLLRTVQDNTEALAEYFGSLGIDVKCELNPGNHFKDAAARSAKGIKAIL